MRSDPRERMPGWSRVRVGRKSTADGEMVAGRGGGRRGDSGRGV